MLVELVVVLIFFHLKHSSIEFIGEKAYYGLIFLQLQRVIDWLSKTSMITK